MVVVVIMVVLVKLSNEWALVHLMFYIYCLLIVEWNNEKMKKIYVQNSSTNFWNSVTYIKKKWWRLLFVKCILFLNSTMSILLLLYNLQFIFSCWVPCSLSRYLVCTCSLTPCLENHFIKFRCQMKIKFIKNKKATCFRPCLPTLHTTH